MESKEHPKPRGKYIGRAVLVLLEDGRRMQLAETFEYVASDGLH